jgi:DNA ligase-1
MSNFKPLLAATIKDTSKLDYTNGVLVSKKLDGIRCMIIDGVVYSRSMKPIRSKVVQKLFGKPEYNGFDGELLYGDWSAKDVFNLTTQAVMSIELKEGFSEDKINLAVFDITDSNKGFQERFKGLKYRLEDLYTHTGVVPQVKMVGHRLCSNEKELLDLETSYLDEGFEGIMVRSLTGAYKQGRSTLKDGILGKLKRFSDDEATVIGFEEKMHNTNEAKTNELGRTQRSQAQEGMVGAGTLGALVCECKGITFTMGSGLDDIGRADVWNNKDKYLGKLAKFKYFAIGMKDSFRFPIFQGWRDGDDL